MAQRVPRSRWWDFFFAFEGLSTSCSDFGFLLSLIAHVGAVRLLDQFGTHEHKSAHLIKLLNGSLAATAITESTGGSDVARIKSQAVRGGYEQLLLSGTKSHITNAPIADFFVIVAQYPTERHPKNISLFLVDRNKGIETSAPESLLGNNTSPTGSLTFKDLKINELSDVIGTKGEGLETLYKMISLDRILYAVVAATQGERLLKYSMDYTSTRRSFHNTLDNYQYVQDKIVGIKINMEISRLVAYKAFDSLVLDKQDTILSGSLAKLVGSEGLWASVQDTMLLHGHSGYESGPIASLFRDIAGVRIAGGTSDIQKVNIFNQLRKEVR